MQVDNNAVLREIFDRKVAQVFHAMVGVLAAALWWLWGRLVQDTGYQEKDGPQNLKQRRNKDVKKIKIWQSYWHTVGQWNVKKLAIA